MTARRKILVLTDEITSRGVPPRVRFLIEGLAERFDVVLVAQCYLPKRHRVRRSRIAVDLYGFEADDYEAKVVAFAGDLAARHAPAFVLAYCWENAKLVVALDELGLPIVSFVDYLTFHPTGQGQLNRIFQQVSEIVLHETVVPHLDVARWALDGRVHEVVSVSLEAMLRRLTPGARLRALVGGSVAREPAGGTAERRELIDRIVAAGAHAAVKSREHPRDRERIETSGLFNFALHEPDDTRSERQALDAYLRTSRFAAPRDRRLAGRLVRRPLEGFNPMIYASDSADFDEATCEDPFAHWLRSGRPEGRWTHTVIRPGEAKAAPTRLAIHVHLHYTDLLGELLERLAGNATPTELFVTTTSDEGRADIARQLQAANLTPRALTVCANLGRDIWPFIALLQDGAFNGYDAVGHFHGKRSPHMTTGADWRDFIWSHLIGGRAPMLDAVAARFAAEPLLGLVFAEEPRLEGWEINKDLATELARRAGIPTPLPNHFEYPMGTMFWARPAALAPLLALGLTAADIPPEPLAVDGTILHALERLVPFFVAQAGFGYATTHVPGSRR